MLLEEPLIVAQLYARFCTTSKAVLCIRGTCRAWVAEQTPQHVAEAFERAIPAKSGLQRELGTAHFAEAGVVALLLDLPRDGGVDADRRRY